MLDVLVSCVQMSVNSLIMLHGYVLKFTSSKPELVIDKLNGVDRCNKCRSFVAVDRLH